jgi:hypothetical protein
MGLRFSVSSALWILVFAFLFCGCWINHFVMSKRIQKLEQEIKFYKSMDYSKSEYVD